MSTRKRTYKSRDLRDELGEDRKRLRLTVGVGAVLAGILDERVPKAPSRDGEPRAEVGEEADTDLGRLSAHEVIKARLVRLKHFARFGDR